MGRVAEDQSVLVRALYAGNPQSLRKALIQSGDSFAFLLSRLPDEFHCHHFPSCWLWPAKLAGLYLDSGMEPESVVAEVSVETPRLLHGGGGLAEAP